MASERTTQLLAWYRSRLRPWVLAHLPAQAVELDAGAVEGPALRVGVVGESGVGKSSLINALLSKRLGILPQGGVGPLTAAPIEVRYADEPFVRITCLSAERVEELLRAVRTDSRAPGLEQSEREASSRARRMAMLLASGSQFGSLPWAEVVAFLQACLFGSSPGPLSPAAAVRVAAVRELLAAGRGAQPVVAIAAGIDLPGMLRRVSAHAAGFLAPLTASIEIGWDTPLLREGVVLVDLPGLGVAHDVYRPATAEQLRQLDVLLVVSDRSGLTQATLDLLVASGVLDPAEAPRALLVAVTKLDQPAEELVAAARQEGTRLAWPEAYAACARRAREVLRAQLDAALAGLLSPSGTKGGARVPVVPVFPRDYQRHHRKDPEEPARLVDPAAAGIDELTAHLLEIRCGRHSDLLRAWESALALLAPHLPHDEARRLRTELRGLWCTR